MKWNYYSKRRNVSLVEFIKGRDIGSYEQLTEELARQSIEPPPKGMFQSAYALAFPPIPKVQKPTPVKKPTAKKPTVKKPAAKKPATKKTTSARRTTRKK